MEIELRSYYINPYGRKIEQVITHTVVSISEESITMSVPSINQNFIPSFPE